jgi:hypothetical protein
MGKKREMPRKMSRFGKEPTKSIFPGPATGRSGHQPIFGSSSFFTKKLIFNKKMEKERTRKMSPFRKIPAKSTGACPTA